MSRILIVDDEEPVRGVVSRLLAAGEHEPMTAACGAEGLDKATRDVPDLVLLDLDLPDADGRVVLSRLRAAAATALVPVILLTGAGQVADKVSGLALGADDYVVKPFSSQELLARINAALQRSRQRLAASPLTGLPGAPAIEEEVRKRLERGADFGFLYADVDGFKAYNDAYGFAQGDVALKSLAALARETSESVQRGFAGHVGGDDFVLVTAAGDAALAAQRLATGFDEAVPGLYSAEDLARGGVVMADRTGRVRLHPLMTLSIGAVTSTGKQLRHYAEVVERASEMKRYLKSKPGRGLSRFAFDRRGPR